jgi:ribosomal protein S27AE
VPYKDPDKYRACSRESAARRRAAKLAAGLPAWDNTNWRSTQERFRLKDPVAYRSAVRVRIGQSKKRLPEHNAARVAVYYAIQTGKLTRPKACSRCGKPCKPEAHHHRGYDRANRLDVLWLCRSCHHEACP